MKKNLLKLVALTFVVSLSLTFTGCGSKKDTSTPSTNAGDTTTNSGAPETQPAETTPAETTPSLTPLEEFVNDPDSQAFADEYSDENFSVELDSENGNILVFRFISKVQLNLDDDTITAMDAQLEEQSTLMSAMAAQIASAIGADDLVVRFVYIDADGTEFLTKDFE